MPSALTRTPTPTPTLALAPNLNTNPNPSTNPNPHPNPHQVRFCSDALGEFQESFIGQLTGQPVPLPLILKGRVVGPPFHFSLEQVDPNPNPNANPNPTPNPNSSPNPNPIPNPNPKPKPNPSPDPSPSPSPSPDPHQIDFGAVSIGFLNTITFSLHNTSEVLALTYLYP